jgi:hypothetical protein
MKRITQFCTPTAGTIVALDEDGQLWQRDADNTRNGPRGTTLYRWSRILGPHDDADPLLEAQVDQFRAALQAAKGNH